MTSTTTTRDASNEESVRKVVTVKAPQAIAWRVFTAQLGAWWPLATHKIGKAAARDAVLEPRVGGRWYELGEDGSTCTWGHVLVWEPTSRLVLSWEISAAWQHDPTVKSEVEVRFIAEADGVTRVELEHRKLEVFGERAAEMRGQFASEGGWQGMLGLFAAAAAA